MRFDYFLNNTLGIDALAEDSRASPDLMIEIFEVRSQIEDAESELELDAISVELESNYADAIDNIKRLIVETTIEKEQVKVHMQEMKYWHQVLSALDFKRDELNDVTY